ncbi:RpiB/LacA/LacB family sugar-phosphate isomerase [Patescibacteria group bacterium]|nr:RpiB/LacA/LacB family sugar-phosphate isomerase [Patescibacteria group bacterium]
MKVYFASDHGGFEYKEELKKYLKGKGYQVEDMGAHELNPKDDYTDFVFPLALRVSKESALRQAQGKEVFGIVLGRSGNGEQIAANKVKGIRAVICLNETMAKKAREHNDANVLSLGADYIDLPTAKKVVDVFLKTPFSEAERHSRRLGKISKYEST